MSLGGSNSSLHTLLETLHRHLSDPGFEIHETHRSTLTDTFNEIRRELYPNYQIDSDLSSGGIQPYWATKVFLDRLKACWIMYHDPDKPPPKMLSALRLEPGLLEHLYCFFLFGEDAVLKRRQLIYWWVGQGLINVEDGKDAEEAADAVLRRLLDAGAIEQVITIKKKRESSKYRLTLLISDLQEHLQDHHKVGELSNDGEKMVLSCPDGTAITEKSLASIEILFNFGASVLLITRIWLQKMKSLKVLHLGRWSCDPEQHLEVEADFQEAFKQLKELRFLSFQGISRIMKISREICKLGENLRVLDLQACHNLEMLPRNIGSLKNLTHLDISKCYLLDRVPKGIISLTKLQVLEGFVISDVYSSSSCKFKDMATHLGKTLRKLSIRSRQASFPEEDDLKAFPEFVNLLKLKIVWVIVSDLYEREASQKALLKTNSHSRPKLSRSHAMPLRGDGEEINPFGLPEKLQKLEVWAIPQTALNSLMTYVHDGVTNLKKLYIIGGKLSDLTKQGNKKWTMVETVRLKYLKDLHMTYRQFMVSFPRVTYLEVVRCPHLTFFPCDENGIWTLTEDVGQQ